MNRLTIRADRLKRLRAICLALPDATEKVAWGDPTWRIRNKIFVMQKGNHAGGRPSIWLKAPDGAQAALVDAEPQLFFVPPYVGNKGWLGIHLDGKSIPWPKVADLIEMSYQLLAPKLSRPRAPGRSRSRTTAARPRRSRSRAAGR